jgi:two-component system response regulator VicR
MVTSERLTGLHILVVEDDVAVRHLIALQLGKEGAEVVDVKDGEEALRAINEAEPDLVMTDLLTPVIGGVELCRRLRAEGRSVPVIIYSGVGEREVLKEALALGGVSYTCRRGSVGRRWCNLCATRSVKGERWQGAMRSAEKDQEVTPESQGGRGGVVGTWVSSRMALRGVSHW